MYLYFTCSKCGKGFGINGYWKWVLTSPFHYFGKRWTKCPHCSKTQLTSWYMITKK